MQHALLATLMIKKIIGVAFLTDRVFKAGTFFHDENDSAAAYFEK